MSWSTIYEIFCMSVQGIFMAGIIVTLTNTKRFKNTAASLAIGFACFFISGLYNILGAIYDTAAGADIRITALSMVLIITAIGVIGKDSIKRKIFIFLACVLFPILFVELPMELYVSNILVPGADLSKLMLDPNFVIYIRMISLTLCVGYSTSIMVIRNRRKIKNYILCVVLLLGIPFIQLVYLTAVFRQEFRTEFFMVMATGAVAVFLTVVLNIMLLLFVRTNIRVHEREKEQIAIASIDKMNSQYMELVDSESERVRKIRHDIGNQLEQVQNLINSHDKQDNEAAALMLNELKSRTNELTELKYCSNPIINTVLVLKNDRARKAEITMDIKVAISEELNIRMTDISSALSNMLDNAINAVSRLDRPEDRQIKVKLEILEGKLFIRVENASDIDRYLIGIDEMLGVSRRRSDQHGYGLKILNDIAIRNNGEFLIENKERICTAILSVAIN